jgi:hypothetical protein
MAEYTGNYVTKNYYQICSTSFLILAFGLSKELVAYFLSCIVDIIVITSAQERGSGG